MEENSSQYTDKDESSKLDEKIDTKLKAEMEDVINNLDPQIEKKVDQLIFILQHSIQSKVNIYPKKFSRNNNNNKSGLTSINGSFSSL